MQKFMVLQNSIKYNLDILKLQIYKLLNFVSVYLFIFNKNNLNIQCLIQIIMQF